MKATKNQTSRAFCHFLTVTNNRPARRLTGQASNRGEQMGTEEILELCTSLPCMGSGATKKCYFPVRGIAVCIAGDAPNKSLGNQLKQQALLWERVARTDDSLFFNPVLRYQLHRGDKIRDVSTRFFAQSILISQQCIVRRDDWEEATAEAVKLNGSRYLDGYGTNYTAAEYIDAVRGIAEKYGLWDVMHNRGNHGLLYDYSVSQYRPVIIDYAL